MSNNKQPLHFTTSINNPSFFGWRYKRQSINISNTSAKKLVSVLVVSHPDFTNYAGPKKMSGKILFGTANFEKS